MGLRNRDLFKFETCFFVTTTCIQFKPLISLSDSYRIIESSLSFVNDKYKADTLAYVIMPNHLHFIAYFKEKNELSNYMRDMKKFTSVQIRMKFEAMAKFDIVKQLRNNSKGRTFQTWMERFDDVYLYNKMTIETKIDYIHKNPLRQHWSLVQLPEEYIYSSAMYYEKGKQPGLKITDYREYFG